MTHRIAPLLIVLALVLAVAPALADVVYVCDDLNRLVRVIDESGRAEPLADSETFVVWVVGFEDAIQYSVEYGVAPSALTPQVLSPNTREEQGEMDALASLLRELERRRAEWREAAKTFKVPLAEPPKWINASPDGRYLLVGFEDPRSAVMRRAVLVRAADFARVKEWQFSGRSSVRDSQWSSDSRVLAVLESSERWSLSPRDLLFILTAMRPFSKLFLQILST